MVGAAQRMLALVANFWAALDRKREMPIIPAAREVHYRDDDGKTWDVAIRVLKRFDPTAYEWGAPASYGRILARGEPAVARLRAWAALCRHASGATAAPGLGWVPAGLLVLRPAAAKDHGPLAP